MQFCSKHGIPATCFVVCGHALSAGTFAEIRQRVADGGVEFYKPADIDAIKRMP